jgi:hypothetical protein
MAIFVVETTRRTGRSRGRPIAPWRSRSPLTSGVCTVDSTFYAQQSMVKTIE